ncbi:MAG TPA: IS3 family transposase, partial [Dehalococcoidia bacterium]|nr:IS3 family transposase [Dehalococcoidia bacterium]
MVPRTTRTDPAAVPAPKLLRREFTAAAPDRCWVGDITDLATGEGWRYRASLVDVHSRRVVGFARADHLRTALALPALQSALAQRHPAADTVLHHTDRGGQYPARAYQAVLEAHGIRPSMRRAGECYDTALAERFNATLKTALAAPPRWPTRQAARAAVCEWVTVCDNRQR